MPTQVSRYFGVHDGGNTGKRAAVILLFCLAWFGRGLRAQDQADLPDTPTAHTFSSADSASDAAPPERGRNLPPLTVHERLRIYRESFTNPESVIGPLLGAAVGQARNTPHEWGQGAAGFGDRLASGYGRSIIARTIALGVATMDGEDPRYRYSGERGILRRGLYATKQTFLSRTPDGGAMPAYSRIFGTYGAAFIANTWEPPSQSDTGHAMLRGSTALASSVGWHIFQEFWPDIRRGVLRRKN